MERGVAFVPGVPGFPPGASWCVRSQKAPGGNARRMPRIRALQPDAEPLGLGQDRDPEGREGILLAAADGPQVGRVHDLAGKLPGPHGVDDAVAEGDVGGRLDFESGLEPLLERRDRAAGRGGRFGGVEDGRCGCRQQEEQSASHGGASARTVAGCPPRVNAYVAHTSRCANAGCGARKRIHLSCVCIKFPITLICVFDVPILLI